MTLEDALGEALLRTALFAEPHSIKGVLAADRLVRRCSALPPDFFENAVQLRQVLRAPRAAGHLRRHVQWEHALDDTNLDRVIGRGVFPLAYQASAMWVERRGLADLVARFRRRAIRRLSHLGHAWTIWCSFREVVPRLRTRHAELLCAERFVELVAAQLTHNDPTRPSPDAELLDGPDPDDSATLDIALCNPGFYAHTVITLAYLHRYRNQLDDAEWRWAMSRVRMMGNTGRSAGASIATPSPSASSFASDRDVETAAVKLALEGPREVHTLTLADAAFDLTAVATPRQKAHLVALLTSVTCWDPERRG